MSDDSLGLLRLMVADAGYRVGSLDRERAFIAESAERVVWCSVFTTPGELMERWQEEQAAALDYTQALSVEKAWELYLVLASEVEPDEREEVQFDSIRRDTAYARKVLVPGIGNLSVGGRGDYLAPLKPLTLDVAADRPDALAQLEGMVREAGEEDAMSVLESFRQNKPLFESL